MPVVPDADRRTSDMRPHSALRSDAVRLRESVQSQKAIAGNAARLHERMRRACRQSGFSSGNIR